MKKHFLVCGLLLLFSFALTSCSLLGGGSTQQLTLTDVDPSFGSFGNSLAVAEITYPVIGEPSFDDFFKTAAKLDGLVKIGTAFSDNAMVSLKNTAVDISSKAELKDQYKALVGDKTPDQLSVEELIQVNQMAVKKGAISKDVIMGYVSTGANMVIVVAALTKGVNNVSQLISQGSQLSSQASSLPPTKAPAAVSAISSTLSNLNNVKDNGPALASSLAKLAGALQAFSAM